MSERISTYKESIENLKRIADETGVSLQEYLLFNILAAMHENINIDMETCIKKLVNIKREIADLRTDFKTATDSIVTFSVDLYNRRTEILESIDSRLSDIEDRLSNIEDNTEHR